jgi:hypothetical protein
MQYRSQGEAEKTEIDGGMVEEPPYESKTRLMMRPP